MKHDCTARPEDARHGLESFGRGAPTLAPDRRRPRPRPGEPLRQTPPPRGQAISQAPVQPREWLDEVEEGGQSHHLEPDESGAARATTSRGRASNNGGQDAASAESAASATMTRYHSGIAATEESAEGFGWY